ncbi:MAG: prepilin-type N-terminal cleavage/methylation domain-containing protein [Defluviicoccus sp.]|nr:MAG: prepilin-type N-terminal cleavage/methylation domain-containing protein [Defluviicoccus sp.]
MRSTSSIFSAALGKRVVADGGFTLLEVLVVLAILGMAATALPLMISNALPGARLNATAQELASDLRILRTSAIRSLATTRL